METTERVSLLEQRVLWAREWMDASPRWGELEALGYDRADLEGRLLRRDDVTARTAKQYLSSWAQYEIKRAEAGLLRRVCLICPAPSRTKYCSPACQRRGERLRLYGMTPEQFQAMLEEQGGRCKICRTADPGLGRTGRARQWSIDHDHACCPQNPAAGEGALCGKCNRGLLCSRCNTGLGYFRDSIEALEAAAAYLRAWESPGRSL